eukprot:jgi/Phyca11/503494/fgenesh2_kg.PHYCAscaffold_4_\
MPRFFSRVQKHNTSRSELHNFSHTLRLLDTCNRTATGASGSTSNADSASMPSLLGGITDLTNDFSWAQSSLHYGVEQGSRAPVSILTRSTHLSSKS